MGNVPFSGLGLCLVHSCCEHRGKEVCSLLFGVLFAVLRALLSYPLVQHVIPDEAPLRALASFSLHQDILPDEELLPNKHYKKDEGVVAASHKPCTTS